MNGFFISSPLKEDMNHPDLVFLLLSCSLIPIIEEIAFRLPLLFLPECIAFIRCCLFLSDQQVVYARESV
jgi:hypothetical protein